MSNAEVLGRFVWHELMTSDTAAAAAFYPKVLPWRTAPSNMPGYTIWMAGQTQIGGLMAQPADSGGAPPHWLIYLGTPNVDTICTQAQGLGARLCKAPGDIPNVGRFAVLADPQGATFAVFTPAAGAPPPGASPAQGGFSWHELATTDVAAAVRFYGELFGWRKGPGHDMGSGRGVYQLFEHGGTQVGGIYAAQGAASAPAWLSYVQVADSSRAVAAAKTAGGHLLNGPMEVPGGSWIAVMTDPQGGAFAVQQPPGAASPCRETGASGKACRSARSDKACRKACEESETGEEGEEEGQEESGAQGRKESGPKAGEGQRQVPQERPQVCAPLSGAGRTRQGTGQAQALKREAAGGCGPRLASVSPARPWRAAPQPRFAPAPAAA